VRIPIRILREVDEGTVKKVKMLALLGTDTTFVLLKKHAKPSCEDKSYAAVTKAVECMIKDDKTFIEVACFYGIIPLAELREFLHNKSFLRRAVELVTGKVVYTQGYSLQSWSFEARMEVLSKAGDVWSSESK